MSDQVAKPAHPLIRYLSARQRLETYFGVVLVVGIVSGLVWNQSVELPTYQVADDFRATIEESQLAHILATDVMYCLIGIVAGLVLGTLAWALFHNRPIMATVMALIGSAVAGVLTRIVAQFIGPKDFDTRISSAEPGTTVRADFGGYTWVPLAFWVGVAMVPILIGALFIRGRLAAKVGALRAAKVEKTSETVDGATPVT